MRPTGWGSARLGSHCEVFSGHPFESGRFSDDPDDIPLVKGENVGQGEILWNIAKRWPRSDVAGLERFSLVPGDVVLAMDRPWIPAGLKFARISDSAPESVLVQRVARLRAREGLEQDFLPYIIGSPEFVGYVRNIGRGVGVPHISGKEIEAFSFRLPPKPTQRRIADILSAYDDLIENNRRRIALLEQAARLLYEEWFVRFRFPGHEHVKITNGVPEGWMKGVVADFYATASGGTPSRKNPSFYGGTINWVKTQELLNGFIFSTEENVTEEAINRSAAKVFPVGTVLVAMYGATIGQLGILAVPSSCNQACCAVVPKSAESSTEYAYLFFMENKGVLRNLSQGAAQNNINQQTIKNFPMLMPESGITDAFLAYSRPILEQIRVLQSVMNQLTGARDLLLPRLMNGEVAV